jgi:hypothetical protein
LKTYTIRPYNPGDESGILELFKAAFKHDRLIEEWRWRFIDNPSGKACIYVCDDIGKIIGHYAVSPAIFNVKGSEYVGTQEIDLMVSSDYTKGLKKAGIFLKLGKILYEHVKRDGIHFTFGFPNQNSSPIGAKHLGWVKMDEIPLYSFYLDKKIIDKKFKDSLTKKLMAFAFYEAQLTFFRLVRSFNSQKLNDIRQIDSFDEDVNTLWKENSKNYEISIIRNADYLNWRFFQHPKKPYKVFGLYKDKSLYGYIALKIQESEQDSFKEGLIVDIFTRWDDIKTAKLLLIKAIDFFKTNKCDVVRSWMMPDFFYNKAFKTSGFRRSLSKVNLYLNHLDDDPVHDILKNSRWFLTMSDSDGV